jgi:hypothetical protein
VQCPVELVVAAAHRSAPAVWPIRIAAVSVPHPSSSSSLGL